MIHGMVSECSSQSWNLGCARALNLHAAHMEQVTKIPMSDAQGNVEHAMVGADKCPPL